MKKAITVVLLSLTLSASSFACPFHHVKTDAVIAYKFVSPVTTPIAHFLYRVGKYIVT
jgi:hypothetical protein